MKIVSFYADPDGNGYFKAAAQRLIEQCRSLVIDYDISEENFGPEWIDNERAKARFLLCKFKELGEPYDFVHYIGNAPSNLQFLERWVATIEAQGRGSHTAFISIFKNLKSEIMPAGYFEIGLSDSPSKMKYFRESER